MMTSYWLFSKRLLSQNERFAETYEMMQQYKYEAIKSVVPVTGLCNSIWESAYNSDFHSVRFVCLELYLHYSHLLFNKTISRYYGFNESSLAFQ